MKTQMIQLVAFSAALALPALAEDAPRPRDLSPVTWLQAPVHAPVELARDGKTRAVVFVADPKPGVPLKRLVDELREVVRLSTGATLERVAQTPPADQPAIVIGDCEETRAAGIDATKLPFEGFVVKTAPNRVYLVGSTQALPAGSNPWAYWANEGTAWAVADFLERFVGVRWYWPTDLGGRCLTPGAELVVPPVHYCDQPVFRERLYHPTAGWPLPSAARWFDKEPLPFADGALPAGVKAIAMASYLPMVRSGNSWPYQVKVHEPQKLWKQWESKWSKHPELLDMFQQKKDGKPNLSMLCYSSTNTLAYLLQGCEDAWDNKKPASWVTPTSVTVSPGDAPLNCQCAACQATMAKGGASLLMGQFVKKMCEAVKQRWPDKKVIFLPYWNYQSCPKDVEFPDNLEIMTCMTGGPMALMVQPKARAGTENNIRAWSAKVNGPITLWDYSDRGGGWTYGPLQFPHVVCDFYRTNRTFVAGAFLNGGMPSDWTTTAPTLYVWMKALWNPELDVDAVLDEMCRRLYGKASGTVRELIRLECERWNTVKGGLADQGRIPPAMFQKVWSPDVVARMKTLRDKALTELADDAVGRQRFLYWTWTFDGFLAEAKEGVTNQPAGGEWTPGGQQPDREEAPHAPPR